MSGRAKRPYITIEFWAVTMGLDMLCPHHKHPCQSTDVYCSKFLQLFRLGSKPKAQSVSVAWMAYKASVP